MPYFPGYTFTDRAGTVLTDTAGAIAKEADRAVGSYLGQALGPNGSLSGTLNSILGLDPNSPIGEVLLALASVIPGIGSFLENVQDAQMFTKIDDTRTRVITMAASYTLADVISAISTITAGGSGGGVPIVITPIQLSDIGQAVWQWTPGDTWGAFQYLRMAGCAGQNLGNHSIQRLNTSNGMALMGRLAEPAALADNPSEWYIDWSDLRLNDSPLSFVTRQFPLQVWTALTGLDYPSTPYAQDQGYDVAWIVFPYSQADLDVIKLSSGLTVTGMAPVWPGVQNVVLGTPVALSALTTVPGPLDGVVIDITTPPTKLSEVAIGGRTFYFRLGTIAFESDNGDMETSQYLQYANAVYCPKAMVRAEAAHLSVDPSAQGTVTPFTVAS